MKKGFTTIQIVLAVLLLLVLIGIVGVFAGWIGDTTEPLKETVSFFGRRGGP